LRGTSSFFFVAVSLSSVPPSHTIPFPSILLAPLHSIQFYHFVLDAAFITPYTTSHHGRTALTYRTHRLVLITFHGVVLLLAGYQADKARTVRTYRAIVDGCVLVLPVSAFCFLLSGPDAPGGRGWCRVRPPGQGEHGAGAANAIYTDADAVSF
jgi:hypothetical protein